MNRASRFPPGKSGGLIEAQGDQAAVRLLAEGFPPGKSGGLIEAVYGWRVRLWGGRCFRRVNPAASLKQHLAGDVELALEVVSAG